MPLVASRLPAFDGGSIGSQLTFDSGLGAIVHLLGPSDGELAIDPASGQKVHVTQAGNAVSLHVDKDGSGSGNALQVDNAGSGAAIGITNDGTGRGINISNATSAEAILVTQTTGGPDVVKVTGSTGNGNVVRISSSSTTGPDNHCLSILHNGTGDGIQVTISSGGTGNALNINQDGDANAILVDHDGDIAAISVDQGTNFDLLSLNKSATGAGDVIDITNSGTGNDVRGNAGNWSVAKDGKVKLGAFTDGTRGDPTTFAAGTIIFNSSDVAVDGGLNICDGTNWRTAAGAIT